MESKQSLLCGSAEFHCLGLQRGALGPWFIYAGLVDPTLTVSNFNISERPFFLSQWTGCVCMWVF